LPRLGYPAAGWVLAAAYLQYASLGLQRAALHLGHFEQPGKEESFSGFC